MFLFTELMNTDPCTQLGHVVKGYTQIADNLQKLKDAYIAQEKAFRKSAAAKRYRLKMIATSLKRKCKNFERLKVKLNYITPLQKSSKIRMI